VYGLLLSTKLLDAIAHRPVTFTLHQELASVGLGLAGVHAFLLALDRSVPFALSEVVVPFAAPYRPLWVGVGQVTLYLMLVVVASFYVRRRIGQRSWRLLHYLSFAAFIGSTMHGLQSGSDSGAAWAWWMYAVAVTLVTFLFVYRVVTAVGARRARTRVRQPIARPQVSAVQRPQAAAGRSADVPAA
jgi:predicted ferric reductase